MSMIGNLLMISNGQLQQLIGEPSLVEDYIYAERKEDKFLNLDKSWHAIHFILNGNNYEGQGPLAMVFFGGEEIGEDHGYGLVRYLTTDQVKQVSLSLSEISHENFSQKYDPQAMDAASIYPNVWERDSAEGLKYIVPFFQDLKKFYNEAALRDQAVLIYIN